MKWVSETPLGTVVNNVNKIAHEGLYVSNSSIKWKIRYLVAY